MQFTINCTILTLIRPKNVFPETQPNQYVVPETQPNQYFGTHVSDHEK
jgi:hypothetical protein